MCVWIPCGLTSKRSCHFLILSLGHPEFCLFEVMCWVFSSTVITWSIFCEWVDLLRSTFLFRHLQSFWEIKKKQKNFLKNAGGHSSYKKPGYWRVTFLKSSESFLIHFWFSFTLALHLLHLDDMNSEFVIFTLLISEGKSVFSSFLKALVCIFSLLLIGLTSSR